jgi:hypothetical protein
MSAVRHGPPAPKTQLGERVYRLIADDSLQGGGIAFVDGGVEAILEGTGGQTYYFYVIAANAVGQSPPSNEASTTVISTSQECNP